MTPAPEASAGYRGDAPGPSDRPSPAPGAVPEVSVVVATFNRAERLRRLLAHLAAQTLPSGRFEVIVVDDCSDDATSAVVAEAAGSGLDLVALRTPANTGGPASPRNLGWRRARAELIAFTDDDCMPEPGWLEAGVEALAGRPEIGVAQGHTSLPPGVDVRLVSRWAIWREVTSETPWFECANIFYRREALRQVGGFDERLVTWGEDTDLGWRVVGAGWSRAFVPEATVVHEVEMRGWRNAARFGWKDSQLVELAARYPGVRAGLWRPWALNRQGAEFVAALGGLCLARRCKPALVLAVPYALYRRPPLRQAGTVRVGLQTVAVDFVRLAGRLRGSLRAGILVV